MRKITTGKHEHGFAVLMDGKLLKPPLGETLVLPDEKLATAVAAEWQAQGEKIRKNDMRLTQLASVAIDLARMRREETLEDVLGYSDTDLLCYRNSDIPDLYILQKKLFTPIIAWANEKFGIFLQITDGIMPVKQPAENQQKIKKAVAGYTEWQLAVFATVVKPLGSIILALAFTEQRINAAEAFRLAHLEETYQTGQWGTDEEKEQKINERKLEIEAAEEFLRLLSL